jgi:hypothetical protein
LLCWCLSWRILLMKFSVKQGPVNFPKEQVEVACHDHKCKVLHPVPPCVELRGK